MSGRASPVRALARDAVRVDTGQVPLAAAVRGGIGVTLPLAIGVAIGQPALGLAVAIGALNVAFSDQPGSSYGGRARRMLAASLGGGVSVFVGATTGGVDALAVMMTAVWGLGAGMLVALGQAEMQVGLTCVSLLVVFSGHPMGTSDALGEAVLVVLGGVFQTIIAVSLWPLRPLGPQQAALGDLYAALGRVAQRTQASAAPPVTAEMNQVSTLLAELSPVNPDAERLRSLLNQAERIRLEVLALQDERSAASECVLRDTAALLGSIAEAIRRNQRPSASDISTRLENLERTADRLRTASADRALLVHLEALSGQLRAAIRIASDVDAEGVSIGSSADLQRSRLRPIAESLATIRANLTLESAVFRHALRLAVCLACADLFARVLGLPWPYWVPLTVSVVLRPEFGATFTRGLGRVFGTFIGLAIATGLAQITSGQDAARVALVGLLVVATRALAAANVALGASMLSAMVVLLLALAGDPPQSTIVARGLDTAIGGVLALAAYATWPTWERNRFNAVLADMLERYREYTSAVFATMLTESDPASAAHLEDTRRRARLARTNALASLSRLRAEPGHSTEMVGVADRVLASSHRFARAVMGLEAMLYHGPRMPEMDSAELRTFSRDVDATLEAVVEHLRGGTSDGQVLASLPDLREDERRLTQVAPALRVQADQIANSLNTMVLALAPPTRASEVHDGMDLPMRQRSPIA